jgi:hypothetical protein
MKERSVFDIQTEEESGHTYNMMVFLEEKSRPWNLVNLFSARCCFR